MHPLQSISKLVYYKLELRLNLWISRWEGVWTSQGDEGEGLKQVVKQEMMAYGFVDVWRTQGLTQLDDEVLEVSGCHRKVTQDWRSQMFQQWSAARALKYSRPHVAGSGTGVRGKLRPATQNLQDCG